MSYPLPPRNRRRADDFDIKEILGEGSLSTVFVTVERATRKRFALKIFDRNILRSNKKDADVTMEEHCLRRVNHPGIVKLYASFRDSEAAYMVLELCEAGELWARVKDVGCPDRLARHHLSQVFEAVAYLRDAQIVHRDLKAENVMISASGLAKLADFGTAKDLANPHIKGAGTTSFKKVLEDNVGTPNFMAPEVIRNKCSDFRSDTWSLGCTIFQVLTGMPPFAGGDLSQVYKRALKARLVFPPGINPDAHDMISRMVVREPDARLGAADMQELRNHQYMDGLGPLGQRFEGAHHQRAPVQSLEEVCLRALGKRWGHLGTTAETWASDHGGQLRDEVRSAMLRFAKVAEVTQRQTGSSSTSSDEER